MEFRSVGHLFKRNSTAIIITYVNKLRLHFSDTTYTFHLLKSVKRMMHQEKHLTVTKQTVQIYFGYEPSLLKIISHHSDIYEQLAESNFLYSSNRLSNRNPLLQRRKSKVLRENRPQVHISIPGAFITVSRIQWSYIVASPPNETAIRRRMKYNCTQCQVLTAKDEFSFKTFFFTDQIVYEVLMHC